MTSVNKQPKNILKKQSTKHLLTKVFWSWVVLSVWSCPHGMMSVCTAQCSLT